MKLTGTENRSKHESAQDARIASAPPAIRIRPGPPSVIRCGKAARNMLQGLTSTPCHALFAAGLRLLRVP